MKSIPNNLAIAQKGGKWGVVSLKNEIVIPFKHKWLRLLGDKTLVARKENDKPHQ